MQIRSRFRIWFSWSPYRGTLALISSQVGSNGVPKASCGLTAQAVGVDVDHFVLVVITGWRDDPQDAGEEGAWGPGGKLFLGQRRCAIEVVREDHLGVAHAAIVLDAGEEPGVVERSQNINIRLCRIWTVLSRPSSPKEWATQPVQGQRGVDGGVGINAVVVAEHHV